MKLGRTLFILSLALSTRVYSAELKCDLNISKYKHAEDSKSEVATKTVKSTWYVNEKDYKKFGKAGLEDNVTIYQENNPANVFKDTNEWEYSDCGTKTIVTGTCTHYFDLDNIGSYKCPTKITFSCNRVAIVKKTLAEYKEELCVRATECASQIENTAQLKSYTQLRDAMCGKDSNSLTSAPLRVKEKRVPASKK